MVTNKTSLHVHGVVYKSKFDKKKHQNISNLHIYKCKIYKYINKEQENGIIFISYMYKQNHLSI